MSNNFLVYHESTGQRLRFKQAVRLESEGSLIWVEYGKTWRNATQADLPQVLAKRAELARTAERMESAELPGIVYESPTSAKAYDAEHRGMVREANQYAEFGESRS